MYKKRTVSRRRAMFFFTERVVNVWNFLPNDVDFSSFLSFKRTILRVGLCRYVDFSCILKYFSFFCISVSVSLFSHLVLNVVSCNLLGFI